MCVCVCVRACVRACVSACVRACVLVLSSTSLFLAGNSGPHTWEKHSSPESMARKSRFYGTLEQVKKHCDADRLI